MWKWWKSNTSEEEGGGRPGKKGRRAGWVGLEKSRWKSSSSWEWKSSGLAITTNKHGQPGLQLWLRWLQGVWTVGGGLGCFLSFISCYSSSHSKSCWCGPSQGIFTVSFSQREGLGSSSATDGLRLPPINKSPCDAVYSSFFLSPCLLQVDMSVC